MVCFPLCRRRNESSRRRRWRRRPIREHRLSLSLLLRTNPAWRLCRSPPTTRTPPSVRSRHSAGSTQTVQSNIITSAWAQTYIYLLCFWSFSKTHMKNICHHFTFEFSDWNTQWCLFVQVWSMWRWVITAASVSCSTPMKTRLRKPTAAARRTTTSCRWEARCTWCRCHNTNSEAVPASRLLCFVCCPGICDSNSKFVFLFQTYLEKEQGKTEKKKVKKTMA